MYKNVYVVVSTKGGEGKTFLSLQVLPILFLNKNINIFEVDNNNNSQKMIENSQKISFKSFKIDDGLDAIDEIEFNNMLSQDDSINIIDAGAGDDTLKLLDILKEKELFGLTYIIPLSNSITNIDNALQTINAILDFDKDAKINLVLNKCSSFNFDDIKYKFKSFFGSELFGLPSRYEEFKDKIQNLNYVTETDLPDIISSKHQYALIDAYLKAKIIMENFDEVKAEWAKKGKEEFLKAKKLNRINEEIYDYCQTLISSFKLD
ncbi:nucleotide-binding protein [Aliarcobacter butzleri]|uniref:nucleotide-binding protein n=1 Tax=Aliarcobacter butzleri TaxID=28197 RepID=UPI00125ED618|nr:hypothetical protein [Aliarcobacter butzleri]